MLSLSTLLVTDGDGDLRHFARLSSRLVRTSNTPLLVIGSLTVGREANTVVVNYKEVIVYRLNTTSEPVRLPRSLHRPSNHRGRSCIL
jgi:hypothetical protein